jgi:hypothetical protein
VKSEATWRDLSTPSGSGLSIVRQPAEYCDEVVGRCCVPGGRMLSRAVAGHEPAELAGSEAPLQFQRYRCSGGQDWRDH